jgi:hypothetical protein
LVELLVENLVVKRVACWVEKMADLMVALLAEKKVGRMVGWMGENLAA